MLDRGQRRAREEKEESAASRPAAFEAEAGEVGERWGSQVRRCVEERTGWREGVQGADRRGTAWAAQQRPTTAWPRRMRAARRGHVARPAKQGRGKGANRWAVATVPGGGTG
jgi:hypothetical protein